MKRDLHIIGFVAWLLLAIPAFVWREFFPPWYAPALMLVIAILHLEIALLR